MDYQAFQNYLEAERERRKTDREREIDKELMLIAEKHRKALVAECAPLYKELADIQAKKSPMPIMVDGKMYEYVGPR